MDSFSEWIDNFLNLGDPEVQTWFLVRQKSFPFIITGFYIIFCTIIGPALMKNRKPFKLKNTLIVYNFLLVIFYVSFLLVIVRYCALITFQQFCHGTPVIKGDVTYTLATACWMVYIVKYIEFLDTVFFILRKKQNQVSFLHVVHHTLVPVCCWFVLRTETSGMVAIPALINAFVHVIMYSYYGLSAMGPHVRKHLWWKRYLTQMQMAQFLVIIMFTLVVVPLSGCRMVITSYIIFIVLAPLFLILFYMYYKSSFRFKRNSPKRIDNGQNINEYELRENEDLVRAKTKNSIARDEKLKKFK